MRSLSVFSVLLLAACADTSSPDVHEPDDDGGGGAGSCVPSEEQCNGTDDDCDGVVDEDCACTAGETQPCFRGDPARADVGSCLSGVQTCDADGAWGMCEGEVLPSDEVCDGADNDCNGMVDEIFDMTTCGLGACQVTVQTCVAGEPQACVPLEPNPVELCDGVDDDCDGDIDEGCSCTDGTTEPCYSGSLATKNVGECSEGMRSCNGGAWGPCVGEVLPTAELCDGLDNDCNPATADGAADPMLNQSCDGSDADSCAEGVVTCMSGGLACSDNSATSVEACDGLGADEDCDGQVDEGFVRNDNPLCSAGQFFLATLSGDTGAETASDAWYNEEWLRFTLSEDSLSSVYVSATITLTSPPGTDYDLYVYCDACGGTMAGASTVGGLNGHSDTVSVRADDEFGVDDTFDVVVEIRHYDSSLCAYWDLDISANTLVAAPTCN